MAQEITKGEKVSKKDKIEQELAKIKEKQKLLEQQRKQIVKVESDKQRKLRARMLIELGAFLFGDRYESAYENMKKDPAGFKKRLSAHFEKEEASFADNTSSAKPTGRNI
jgi:hypothetical protein